jgi:hypothetical protein
MSQTARCSCACGILARNLFCWVDCVVFIGSGLDYFIVMSSRASIQADYDESDALLGKETVYAEDRFQ